jgi:4-hydroxythreonine-4-phosphate dehydrogenase
MNLRKNPTLKSCKIKVGITIGDPSGIGPAITLKAIKKLKGLAEFVVIGDKWVLKKVQGSRFKVQGFNLIDLDNISHKNFKFGKIKVGYGRASIEYLDKALELIKKREIDCLVTCPISKEAVNLAGLKGFLGHTEYLARHTNTREFAMMLVNENLRFGLLTRHIPLKEVSGKINEGLICKTVILTHRALREIFGIKRPRLVVCGLNPHASDNGLIGREENTVIKPALEKLRNKFMMRIDGPLPADAAIFKANSKDYDCVIVMYHDQALIPLKLGGINTGVNLTLGLPFVRTSPLHGTAFDIAGSDLAKPDSLIEAIKLAIKCTQNLKKA